MLKATKFPEQNIEIAKDQEEYNTLPALVTKDQYGSVITCWKAGFWQRVKFLFTGRLWMNTMTFNHRFQPVLLTLEKEEAFKNE